MNPFFLVGRKALRGWCVGWIVAGRARMGPGDTSLFPEEPTRLY